MSALDDTSLYSTKGKAVNEGSALLQRFGFNGFSFQDVADVIGIKKPSLYDHFHSKEEFGLFLISTYRTRFHEWTETIRTFSPTDQISALFDLFFKFSIDQQKLCPLSALIADYNVIPDRMVQAVHEALEDQRHWMRQIIRLGQAQRRFRHDIPSEILADSLFAMALGAQLMARASQEPQLIRTIKSAALHLLHRAERPQPRSISSMEPRRHAR